MRSAKARVKLFFRSLLRPSKNGNLRRIGRSGEVPQNFLIRDARRSDLAALAALHVKTFNETHTVLSGGPSVETRYHQWNEQFSQLSGKRFCLVIENSKGELIGFAKGIPHLHAPVNFQGELNKIYLLRKYHRLGLGRRLLGEVAVRFMEQGIFSMLLFGEADNPSNFFYEALEGEKIVAANGAFHGAYGWRNLERLAMICTSKKLSYQNLLP